MAYSDEERLTTVLVQNISSQSAGEWRMSRMEQLLQNVAEAVKQLQQQLSNESAKQVMLLDVVCERASHIEWKLDDALRKIKMIWSAIEMKGQKSYHLGRRVGRTGGRTDGRAGGGRTDGQAARGRTDEQTDGRTDGWTER